MRLPKSTTGDEIRKENVTPRGNPALMRFPLKVFLDVANFKVVFPDAEINVRKMSATGRNRYFISRAFNKIRLLV